MSIAVLNPSRLDMHERVLEILQWCVRDRVEHEIERAVDLAGLLEDPGDVLVLLDVAGGDQPGADRVGELADPTLHLVARQVGEPDLGPLVQQLAGDRPGDAEVVGDPQDQPLLARE